MAIYQHDAEGNASQIASNYITGDTLPIGSQIPFSSLTIPDNWLLCDGRAISRADYSELFTVIGTSYGVGDGSTTFNLPNKKGRTSVGYDTSQTEFNTVGKTGGSKYTEKHSHIISNKYGNVNTGSNWASISPYDNAQAPLTSNTVTQEFGTGNAGNLQPYETDVWIIKAKQSSGVVATVVDDLTSTSTTNALSANMGRELKSLIDLFKPTVLYNNSTGTTGTVTLSETSANFSTIKIFYMSGGGGYNSVEVYQPNGKRVYLITNAVGAGVSYFQNKLVEINGTSITNVAYNQNSVGTGSVSSGNDNNNHIVRVVGYK